MSELPASGFAPKIWAVGALCRAVADALDARFNPVAVRGEISGFARASSGHCYFSLKDESGQIRAAMFRRAASLLDFTPRDGELVEVRGRLGVYEQRGDLQLIVESMTRAGAGALFERFVQLKAKLDAQGLFDASRKRPLPVMPRAIGLVTSLGAAALHDVVTALKRRVPHIAVVLAPAAVQGNGAAVEMVRALQNLYLHSKQGRGLEANLAVNSESPIDVILLVRGGGSMEDLWAFNDEQLAHTLVLSPVPVISGIGHETDFTIADFCADVRAPTPTAAAELAAQPREVWLGALDSMNQRLADALLRQLDRQSQRLDSCAARMGRPSGLAARQRLRLSHVAQRLQMVGPQVQQRQRQELLRLQAALPQALQRALAQRQAYLRSLGAQLALLNPALVLERGYAWLTDDKGAAVSSVQQAHPGQALHAVLNDGELKLTVDPD